MIIKKLESGYSGYKLIVDKWDVICRCCKKRIEKTHSSYLCKGTKQFWCYECRFKRWGGCNNINYHEHIHINSVKEV